MLVTANVLWALNYASTKFALEAWQPLAFSQLRFSAAALLSCSIVLARERSLRIARADVAMVVAAAATGIFLNQVLFNYAVQKTTAANVALILASAPAFTALFVVRVGQERLHLSHWLGLAVALAGVAIVVGGGGGVAGGSLFGNLLAVGAAVTWAAYSVMLRPLFGRYSAFRLSALMIAIGAVMLLPLSLPQVHGQDYAAIGAGRWAAWCYSTIFPLLVTNLLYFRSLRRVGAARATLYMYLQPFLAVVFAAVLLGEEVAVIQLAGGLIIIAGVALGRRGPRPRGVEVQPADAG